MKLTDANQRRLVEIGLTVLILMAFAGCIWRSGVLECVSTPVKVQMEHADTGNKLIAAPANKVEIPAHIASKLRAHGLSSTNFAGIEVPDGTQQTKP